MNLNEDSEETVAGPTNKDDDSDADMAGPTDIDDDDDDNDGNDDGPSPNDVVASAIPCDPPVTKEDEIRLVEGGLVENLEVSLSEGEAKEYGKGETMIKIKLKPLPKPCQTGMPHNLGANICCFSNH